MSPRATCVCASEAGERSFVAAGFWDSYLKLVDWSKHQSTHAQGNVCFGVPIVQYVPFNRVSEGI